jgi:hypothetical protein
MQFFETLNLDETREPESLLREIIFRFGPPDPSCLDSGMAA